MRDSATILVADDDPAMLTIVSRVLRLNGFSVEVCRDGQSALKLEEQINPSLVILDWKMPLLDGIAACQRLRRHSDVPIIMLTALDDESDVAKALEAGADDYIRKPFGPNELVARVRAVLRRTQAEPGGPETLEAGPLIVDEVQHVVSVDGRDVLLSRTEFSLLRFLIRNRNRVLTHDQILERVWGADYIGSHHMLRVAMSRLRQKLGVADGLRVETLSGVGYRLQVLADQPSSRAS